MKSRTQFHWTTRSGGLPALLVLAACAAGLLVPALASANPGQHDRRDEGRRGEERRRVHRPVRHRYPVYVPAPIYYPHYESPGIRIVIPFDLR